jgi:small-conductance mechanosensitive channel
LGDEVIIGDKKGIVYDIGPWNTKLKGENSEIITVPNKFATNSIIVNLGRKNRK